MTFSSSERFAINSYTCDWKTLLTFPEDYLEPFDLLRFISFIFLTTSKTVGRLSLVIFPVAFVLSGLSSAAKSDIVTFSEANSSICELF